MGPSRQLLSRFRGKRVLLTGDTGFKGSWLALWLSELGAEVTGIALPPPTNDALFFSADVASHISHRNIDIRDYAAVETLIQDLQPEIVFHLAAQSLVGLGYSDPIATYETNVMGTLHVLLACSKLPRRPKIVNVTSDKCYRNDGCGKAYTEGDELGGKDPYSNSKSCAELVAQSVKYSFYSNHDIASVRAGNVIGGGDWCEDRLIPDLFRAVFASQPLTLRNPAFVRPWQFVLEPLFGYLLVGEALLTERQEVARAWNFGPEDSNMCPAQDLVDSFISHLGDRACEVYRGPSHIATEASVLKLSSAAAREKLGWRPVLTFDEMVAWTTEGYLKLHQGLGASCMVDHIHRFTRKVTEFS